jgi:CheY-like chemotaxis protein
MTSPLASGCKPSGLDQPRPGNPVFAPDADGALRILVADDTHVTRVFVSKLLERCGHHVTTVTGGREAVAAATSDGFDLVLMDVHMPGMNGLQATEALRSVGFKAPVFALTATLANEDTSVCLAAGMDACLRKPLDLVEFAEQWQLVRQQR